MTNEKQPNANTNTKAITVDADKKTPVIDRPRPLRIYLDERKKTKSTCAIAEANTKAKKDIFDNLQKGFKGSVAAINTRLTEEKAPRINVHKDSVASLGSDIQTLESKIQALKIELRDSEQELKKKVSLHGKSVSKLDSETVKVGKEIDKEQAKEVKQLKAEITAAKKDYKSTLSNQKHDVAKEKRRTFGKTAKEITLLPLDLVVKTLHAPFHLTKLTASIFKKNPDRSYTPPTIFKVKRAEPIVKKKTGKKNSM